MTNIFGTESATSSKSYSRSISFSSIMFLIKKVIGSGVGTVRGCATDRENFSCDPAENGRGLKVECLFCESDFCNGVGQHGSVVLLAALPIAVTLRFLL